MTANRLAVAAGILAAIAFVVGVLFGFVLAGRATATERASDGPRVFEPVTVGQHGGSQTHEPEPANPTLSVLATSGSPRRDRPSGCVLPTGQPPLGGSRGCVAAADAIVIDPAPSRTPVPRASVEQPAAALLTVSKGAGGITGTASYYDWRPGEAAACAPLRAALGAGWRGRVVSVNGIAVRLTDYCPQEGRVIDLDSRTFASLAPLTRGVIRVTVTWGTP